MYSGIVYRYICPNGKSYIGQTTKTLKERAKGNGSGYIRCKVFYKAILKYGWSNFKVEILSEYHLNDLDELIKHLNEDERKYIQQYNSLIPNGYNIRIGGDSGIIKTESIIYTKGSKHFNWNKEIDDNYLIELYNQGKTLQQISDKTHYSKQTIQRHLKDAGVLKITKHTQRVIKYDKQGNIVNKWDSITEAEDDEGRARNSIGRHCREKRGYYKGYIYRFEGDEI